MEPHPPQTLSVIRALLAERGITPRKRFGQNFLHDPNKLRVILDAAAIAPGDIVLEVGPGTGVLTEPMLAAGARVVAVEIDTDMCGILRDRIGPDTDRFTLLNADVMDGKRALNPQVDESLRRKPESCPTPLPFKLVANLPYNTASPLIATLVTDYAQMTSAVVMVQREVAARLTAIPGGKDYGPLGVLVQAMCACEKVTDLSPHCFWPEPEISSTVVRLTRRLRPLTADPHRLAATLHALFSKRRKQIGSILGRDAPLPPGIDPNARPEQLAVEQLVAIAETNPARGKRSAPSTNMGRDA